MQKQELAIYNPDQIDSTRFCDNIYRLSKSFPGIVGHVETAAQMKQREIGISGISQNGTAYL